MRQRIGVATVAAAIALAVAGCASIGSAPNPTTNAASRAGNVTSQKGPIVYAFSPEQPLVASYLAGDRNDSKPIGVIEGSKTQLATGNGMAVDAGGTIYVVVSGGPAQSSMNLLAFAPNARGNVAPERTAQLVAQLLAGYAVGLALDGHGNFWLSAIRQLLRFPASANGVARPNSSIAVQIATPYGLMSAHSSNVAVDSKGRVYCACAVVYHGLQAIGVSEYALTGSGAKLVRSFYDPTLPEVPPSSIAVDAGGTIYLASGLPNAGVFAYAPGTKSGQVLYSRHFVGRPDTMIASLTTDAAGNVYVAAGSSILIYGPHANGRARPIASIIDPRHLHYGAGDYGTLLNVR